VTVPRHVEHFRVAWSDTDAAGRIHFTAAFRWAEAAETGLRRALGILEDTANYPRRAVEAEYLDMLRFEDEIDVEIGPEHVGTTSVTYTWEIRRDGHVCIRGRHTAVYVDDSARATPLPTDVRRVLSAT
jgi:acyl-CoA thioesterase FadM